MKDTFYFPHDYSARNDDKIAALIAEQGLLPYALYWVLVELLHEAEDSRIELSEKKLRRLAAQARLKTDELTCMIDLMITEYELFTKQDGYLCNARVLRNKNIRREIKERKSAAGKKGAATRWQNDSTAITEDGKEIKEIKETKEKKDIFLAGDNSPKHTNSSSFLVFKDWIIHNAPYVAQMTEPFTQEQYDKIQHLPLSTMHSILMKMHNHNNLLKANRSAYHTFTTWHSREPKPEQRTNNIQYTSTDTGLPDARELLRQKNAR